MKRTTEGNLLLLPKYLVGRTEGVRVGRQSNFKGVEGVRVRYHAIGNMQYSRRLP
jgi:hypothetical protein